MKRKRQRTGLNSCSLLFLGEKTSKIEVAEMNYKITKGDNEYVVRS